MKIKKEKPVTSSESNLMYDSKYSFSDYRNVRKYYNFFFKSKYDNLLLYKNRLNELKNLVPRTKKNKN